jgi:hypothetical protein
VESGSGCEDGACRALRCGVPTRDDGVIVMWWPMYTSPLVVDYASHHVPRSPLPLDSSERREKRGGVDMIVVAADATPQQRKASLRHDDHR